MTPGGECSGLVKLVRGPGRGLLHVELGPDRRNLLLIALASSTLLVLVPPQHDYPIIDDWIYAGSVRVLLETGRFDMPPMSQANLVGLTVWGAGWVRLFGFSFSTPT